MPTETIDAKEYVNSAVKKIELMKGRDLPEIVVQALVDFFNGVGEIKTKAIIYRLKTYDKIPDNIIGCIDRLNNEIHNTYQEQEYKPKNREDLGDPSSAGLMGEFMTEVFLWHELRLVERNTDNPCGVLDIEQWVAAGRPKSWSPIIDNWLEGFEAAYYMEKTKAGSVKIYMESYIRKLKKERTERQHNQEW